MKSNWLYDQSAHSIVLVLLLASLLAFELAYRAGRRWHADTHDAGREVYVALKVALLGLLALLLAFAFGMAADRYTERQRLVTEEANILHRVFLYGSLLPPPARAQFQKSFRELVDARLAFYDAGQNLGAVAEAIDRTEKLHGQLWGLVRDGSAARSTDERLGRHDDGIERRMVRASSTGPRFRGPGAGRRRVFAFRWNDPRPGYGRFCRRDCEPSYDGREMASGPSNWRDNFCRARSGPPAPRDLQD